MAYVNVKDWSVEQVTEWLKGLDSVIAPYITSFINNEVKGDQLLSLRSEDLEHLGIFVIGHQEIILEAVEYLRNFHYRLDKENLQSISFHLSCTALSLYKDLCLTNEDCTAVPTQTMSDVHNVITVIKQLVCWLDRSPFRGDKDYADWKTDLLQLSFEMATSTNRGVFSEKPLRMIRDICNNLTQLADHIVQDMLDPMILQPATLALATLKKKKEQELGFFLVPSHYAVHQIAEIKFGSPAHNNSKIEEGDEIVQVNYQTVVGWHRKKVLMLLQESPPELVLTLKKRPRHTKVYGQIYMKPYRLPSKKRVTTPYSRWNDNLPSPQLLAIYDLPQLPRLPRTVPAIQTENEMSNDSSSDGDSSDNESPLEESESIRNYPSKPRPVLQRRNTITGASPTHKKPHHSIEQFWQQLKNQAAYKHTSSYNIESSKDKDQSSTLLRDKSVSYNEGIQMVPRPTTVIGFSSTQTKNGSRKKTNAVNFKTSFDEINRSKNYPLPSLNESFDYIDEGHTDLTDRSDMKIYWQVEIVHELVDKINFDAIRASAEPTIATKSSNSFMNDVKDDVKPMVFPKCMLEKPPELPVKPKLPGNKPAIPPKNFKSGIVIRGCFSKSNSAPTYDQTNDNTSISDMLIDTEEQQTLPKEKDKMTNFKDTPNMHQPPAASITKHEQRDVASSSSSPSLSPNTATMKGYDKVASKLDCSSHSIASQQHSLQDFDAQITSTPVSSKSNIKCDLMEFENESKGKASITVKSTQAFDSKISPTNSIVKAMMYSGKSKNTKKKNNLIAKRRSVSIKDVSPGELQGYLHQRSRSKQTQPVMWTKLWFILNSSCLYGFETKSDLRAKCLIFLSGFTVSVADEVKSRSNAFKVYHTGTVFYFSAENKEALANWIESLSTAALLYKETKLIGSVLYSESDDDSCCASSKNRIDSEEHQDVAKKFSSLKKLPNVKKDPNRNDGSSSLDRKWFFNKGNKNLPVPTAQFRSYRKMPASVSTGNFTSHVPSMSSSQIDTVAIDATPPTTTAVISKSKTAAHRYAYASNPNLCEIADSLTVRNYATKNAHNDFAGFVTLEELMNRQSEDQKLNPYSIVDVDAIDADFVYGELTPRKSDSGNKVDSSPLQSATENGSLCFAKRSSIKKCKKSKDTFVGALVESLNEEDSSNSRSLPRTHRLNSNDKSRKNNLSKKEYSVSYIDLKDHSSATKKSEEKPIVRQHSLTTPDKKEHKFSLNSLKRGDKISDKSAVSLKSVDQYTPISLPLNCDQTKRLIPALGFELNLDDKSKKSTKFRSFFSKHGFSQHKNEKSVLFSGDFIRDVGQTPKQSFHHQNEEVNPYKGYSQRQNHPITLTNVADYPGLEYPPVFEPETYTLSDPRSNLSILRKQDKNC